MLVLARKIDEQIMIDGGIVIKVLRVRGDTVWLGISADPSIRILREELVGQEPRRERP
jgi:carbon storage regulator